MSYFLIAEEGGYLLQEDGVSKILLEQSAPPTPTTPTITRPLSAAWFGIPRMRAKILKEPIGKEKVYLKSLIDELKNGQ